MARIHLEDRNGILIKYVNAQDGIKLYLLPNVPTDAGRIEAEGDFPLEEAVKRFPVDKQEKVRQIGKAYDGRQLDAASILLYAEEQGRFDEFVQRLEAKEKDFAYIHPSLRLARTDITAFFMRQYADLGKAPEEEAARTERQLEDYGPCVAVFPD